MALINYPPQFYLYICYGTIAISHLLFYLTILDGTPFALQILGFIVMVFVHPGAHVWTYIGLVAILTIYRHALHGHQHRRIIRQSPAIRYLALLTTGWVIISGLRFMLVAVIPEGYSLFGTVVQRATDVYVLVGLPIVVLSAAQLSDVASMGSRD